MLDHSEVTDLTQKALTTAIIRNPITVSAQTTVREAIALMSETRSLCGANSPEQTDLDPGQLEARASCVVIVEAQKVVGIFTEQDVVRLCANQQLLDEIPISQVMTTSVQPLPESALTNLFSAMHRLQQNHIRHLPVVDAQDCLVGLVTHDTLQQKHLQREQMVADLATQIRSSLSLQTILETAVVQIHQAMGCDRVNIWKFEPDLSTVVVAESTHSSRSLMGERVRDECYQQHITEVYREGHIRVVPDIYTTAMADCHREFLISLQTRAKILLPLFCGEQLWGLLNVSESHTPRDWQADEVDLLRKLATQLTIAIHQASIHEQLQVELQERQQAEAQLRQNTERLQEAQRIAHLGHWENDLQHNTLYWCEEVFRLFEIDPQQFGASYEAFLDLVHPEDRLTVSNTYSQHLRDRQPYNLVHRLQMPDSRIKYLLEQCETTFSADGTPLISRGTVQDITLQKEAEICRDRAEASLRQVIEGTAAFTGKEFFPALVRHIGEALGVRYVSVGQATSEGFQVLAFFADGELRPPPFLPYDLVPCCYQTLQTGGCCHPAGIQALYPGNTLFTELKVESYLGVRLRNTAGEPTGNLCIFHDAPLTDPDWAQTLVSIFAGRAGAELERLLTAQAMVQLNADLEARVTQRTAELAEREAMLQDFLDNASDLIQIVDIDTRRFKFVNRTWRNVLGYTIAEVEQLTCFDVLAPDCHAHCETALAQMRSGHITTLDQVELIFVSKSGQRVVVEGNVNCRFGIGADGRQRAVATRGIFRDITARKVAQQELQESQQFLQTVLDTVPLSVFWKDRDFNYLGANQRFLRDAALSSAADLVGKNDFDMPWGAIEAQAYRADDRTVIDTGTAKLGIIETQHQQDGTELWLETNKLPLHNLAGDVIGVLGTYQDITDRQNAEIVLRRQLAAIEAAIDGIAILQDERYVYLNSSHVELFGYQSTQELIGKSWRVLYSPEELARFDQEILPALKDRMYWQGEVTATRKDGTTFPEQLSLTLSADNLLICVSQDISDRKRVESQLQASQAYFQSIVSDQTELICRFLPDGTLTFVNHAYCQFFQKSPEQLIGQNFKPLLPEADQDIPATYFRRLSIDQPVVTYEHRVLAPNGAIHWQQWTDRAFFAPDGTPIEFQSVGHDITTLKEAETQLLYSNQELQRATRLKDEFLANMSHELRTPLNAILGMTEGLQDEVFGIVNEGQLKALHTIESSATHLLALINDILDVAKIEAGQVRLEYSQVSVKQLCASSLTFVKQQALNKRIQLTTQIPSHLSDLCIDEIRMRQVLLNLLTNAVKFTLEGGTVTLTVTLLPPTQDPLQPTYLRIAIADTGIGIAPENISRLFQPFVQIDGALNRQHTGTGLGLALVKQIVELHGGRVGLTSELGVGSCFTIDLPYESEASPPPNPDSLPISNAAVRSITHPSRSTPTQTPLILLAEDNSANVETISSYLEAKGYRFLFASNGQEAIDLALSHYPDVILMDIQMPGMDGLEAIRQIRQQESVRETPIIALTALAMEGDRESCLAAGANHYLSKPVKLKQLDLAIKELIADRWQTRP